MQGNVPWVVEEILPTPTKTYEKRSMKTNKILNTVTMADKQDMPRLSISIYKPPLCFFTSFDKKGLSWVICSASL